MDGDRRRAMEATVTGERWGARARGGRTDGAIAIIPRQARGNASVKASGDGFDLDAVTAAVEALRLENERLKAELDAEEAAAARRGRRRRRWRWRNRRRRRRRSRRRSRNRRRNRCLSR